MVTKNFFILSIIVVAALFWSQEIFCAAEPPSKPSVEAIVKIAYSTHDQILKKMAQLYASPTLAERINWNLIQQFIHAFQNRWSALSELIANTPNPKEDDSIFHDCYTTKLFSAVEALVEIKNIILSELATHEQYATQHITSIQQIAHTPNSSLQRTMLPILTVATPHRALVSSASKEHIVKIIDLSNASTNIVRLSPITHHKSNFAYYLTIINLANSSLIAKFKLLNSPVTHKDFNIPHDTLRLTVDRYSQHPETKKELWESRLAELNITAPQSKTLGYIAIQIGNYQTDMKLYDKNNKTIDHNVM